MSVLSHLDKKRYKIETKWKNFGKTRGNGFGLHQGRFKLDIRKHFISVRAVRQCHRLPREAVESLSVELFQNVDEARRGRGEWAWWDGLMVGLDDLGGLFQP